MRSMLRLFAALGLLLGGFVGFGAVANAAPSTTIEITDVYNAVNSKEEWFQLYNMTKGAITLDGWKICTNDVCLAIPSTKVEPFSLAKIKSTSISGWPDAGLNGSADMLGLLDNSGAAVDSMNWGTPASGWKNYPTFSAMLWNPGIKAPDAATNQSYFRMAIGNDTDKPGDWLTTSSKPVTTDTQPAAPTATAAPAAPTATAQPAASTPAAPAPTATTAAPSGGTTGAGGGATTTGQNPTGTTNPQTGGEFPILLGVALLAALIGVRYLRRNVHAGASRH